VPSATKALLRKFVPGMLASPYALYAGHTVRHCDRVVKLTHRSAISS
jgi:hypothetical protein